MHMLNVKITDEHAKMLDQLAERYGCTVTAVVRRAIATETWFAAEVDSGKRICVVDDESSVEVTQA